MKQRSHSRNSPFPWRKRRKRRLYFVFSFLPLRCQTYFSHLNFSADFFVCSWRAGSGQCFCSSALAWISWKRPESAARWWRMLCLFREASATAWQWPQRCHSNLLFSSQMSQTQAIIVVLKSKKHFKTTREPVYSWLACLDTQSRMEKCEGAENTNFTNFPCPSALISQKLRPYPCVQSL